MATSWRLHIKLNVHFKIEIDVSSGKCNFVTNRRMRSKMTDLFAYHLFDASINRPFSYSEKESQSNDTLLHVVEFSNVHNSDRSSNATRSNLVYKNV